MDGTHGLDGLIAFHITITDAQGVSQEVIERHPDAVTAAAKNLTPAYGWRVEVRPLVEKTRLQGKLRYPHPLHVDATDEARAGWTQARAEREFAMADHHALRLQVQRQDLATQVCMGFRA